MEMTLDAATNCDWCTDRLDVVLIDEDLLDLLTEYTDMILFHEGSLSSCLEPVVNVNLSHVLIIKLI